VRRSPINGSEALHGWGSVVAQHAVDRLAVIQETLAAALFSHRRSTSWQPCGSERSAGGGHARSLLASRSEAVGKHLVAPARGVGRAASPPAGFNGRLAARVSNLAGQALAMTSVSGTAAHARRQLAFRIDLLGAGQQVAATALQLRYAGKHPAACAGTVAQLDTAGFAGTCHFSDGTTQTIQASWKLNGNNLAGQLHLATTS
jgi:hypothetical protein